MAIVMPIVVSISRYADVHASCVAPVVVDDMNAAVAAGVMAEPVVFASCKAQSSDGQYDD